MKPKRIGLNLLFINPSKVGGSVVYALKLISEISKIDKYNNYFLYINKDCLNMNFNVDDNFKIRVLNFRYSSPYYRYLWEQFVLPFYLVIDRINLLHSPGYVTPILTHVPRVVSILDINYIGHSQNMKFLKRILLGFMVNLSAIFSKKIITISSFSKKQITKYTIAKKNKVIVTLLSGSEDYLSNNKKNIKSVKLKYKIDSDYIICFSSSSPHKNIDTLILAIQETLRKTNNLKLVLVGHVNDNICDLIRNLDLEDQVIITGFVTKEHKFALLKGAKIFVFPSLYEGFGIPLLDAQLCEVPIVSSNSGSLPEVAGQEAFYFDPTNKLEINNTIIKVLSLVDKNKKETFIESGLKNRKKFSWNLTAKKTLVVYNNI